MNIPALRAVAIGIVTIQANPIDLSVSRLSDRQFFTAPTPTTAPTKA